MYRLRRSFSIFCILSTVATIAATATANAQPIAAPVGASAGGEERPVPLAAPVDPPTAMPEASPTKTAISATKTQVDATVAPATAKADAANEAKPELTTSVEVRPRFEAMAPRDLNGGKLAYGILRSRLGVKASLTKGWSAFVQMQDTRFFGGSQPVPGFAPDPTVWGRTPEAFDLHQGYVEWRCNNYVVRTGRQEISFGNERLIGTLDWANPGRTFDAIRAGYSTATYDTGVFGALTLDTAPLARGPDTLLTGAYVEQKRKGQLNVGAIVLYDAAIHGARFNRVTVGTRVAGPLGPVEIDVDGYVQLHAPEGSANNYAAFMAGARVKYPVTSAVKVGVVADVVSGQSSATWGAFNTLYGTNHKFYGFYDLFLNIPKDTNNHGLIDGALTADLTFRDYTATAFVHVFRAATYNDSGSAWYGAEPDVVISKPLAKNIKADVGVSAFVPFGAALGRGDHVSWFSYSQLSFKY